MKTLGLIPARGGSKGVSGKNIKLLGGRPLIAYTVDAALASRRLDRVVLTTDDENIAAVGRSLGVDVPFIRPPHLATDDAPTLPVVQHALTELEGSGDNYDAVCVLQPTNPFRATGLVDNCVALLARSSADSVVTVRRTPAEFSPHWAYEMQSDGRLVPLLAESEVAPRRQSLPPTYHRDGSVYVTRVAAVNAGSLYGAKSLAWVVDSPTVNIDEPADWKEAERFIAHSSGSASR